jgi:hypothetical protein
MVIQMKTTVEISDAVLEAARRRAAARGTTLRALIEEGLRCVLEDEANAEPFVLRDASVPGQGMRPGVQEGQWETLAALIYEGRGG